MKFCCKALCPLGKKGKNCLFLLKYYLQLETFYEKRISSNCFPRIYTRPTSGFTAKGIQLVCKGKNEEGNTLTTGTEDKRDPDQVPLKRHFYYQYLILWYIFMSFNNKIFALSIKCLF